MAKATITWKGEEGTEEITWRGQTFKKGEAIETEDAYLIEKARNNPQFDCEVTEEDEKSAEAPAKPPSQQGAQGPATKPGEPPALTRSGGSAPPVPPKK